MSYFYIGKYGTLLVCLCERESGHYFLFTFNIWAGNKLIIIIVVVVVVVIIVIIIIIIIMKTDLKQLEPALISFTEASCLRYGRRRY